jgi:hypothetical protein
MVDSGVSLPRQEAIEGLEESLPFEGFLFKKDNFAIRTEQYRRWITLDAVRDFGQGFDAVFARLRPVCFTLLQKADRILNLVIPIEPEYLESAWAKAFVRLNGEGHIANTIDTPNFHT